MCAGLVPGTSGNDVSLVVRCLASACDWLVAFAFSHCGGIAEERMRCEIGNEAIAFGRPERFANLFDLSR